MRVESAVTLSVYVLAFLIGLPANIVALYAFSARISASARPSPTAVLLLNLTVSDLVFLMVLPIKMYEAASDMRWDLPDFVCSVTTYLFYSTIYTSCLLLMAVSILRYVAVAFPVAYQRLFRPTYAIATSAACWLVSLAHCVPVFVVEHHPSLSASANGSSAVCYEDFTPEQLAVLRPVRVELFVVFFLIPFSVCVYCYLACIRILYARPGISRTQKRKSIGMALGSLAVFVVCVMPYNLSHVAGYFKDASPEWRYYTALLRTFSACLNPVVFYFSSSTFRDSVTRRCSSLMQEHSYLTTCYSHTCSLTSSASPPPSSIHPSVQAVKE